MADHEGLDALFDAALTQLKAAANWVDRVQRVSKRLAAEGATDTGGSRSDDRLRAAIERVDAEQRRTMAKVVALRPPPAPYDPSKVKPVSRMRPKARPPSRTVAVPRDRVSAPGPVSGSAARRSLGAARAGTGASAKPAATRRPPTKRPLVTPSRPTKGAAPKAAARPGKGSVTRKSPEVPRPSTARATAKATTTGSRATGRPAASGAGKGQVRATTARPARPSAGERSAGRVGSRSGGSKPSATAPTPTAKAVRLPKNARGGKTASSSAHASPRTLTARADTAAPAARAPRPLKATRIAGTRGKGGGSGTPPDRAPSG